jgi:hypothetical protein
MNFKGKFRNKTFEVWVPITMSTVLFDHVCFICKTYFFIRFFYSQHDILVSIGIVAGIIALLFGLTF